MQYVQERQMDTEKMSVCKREALVLINPQTDMREEGEVLLVFPNVAFIHCTLENLLIR